jgi:hypothetical protein
MKIKKDLNKYSSAHAEGSIEENPLKNKDSNSCPCLMSCVSVITEGYFVKLCNSTGFEKCHQLARMMNRLKTPIEWLQVIAMKKAQH